MVGRVALASALVGLTALLACDSPRPASCEGERVGALTFHGDVVADGGCPFTASAVDFTATVAFDGDGGALLCIERADAEPLRGTHDGDHLAVSAPDGGANVPSCACAVQVAESVEGDLSRDGGAVAGFAGELRDHFWPADGGAGCERDAGPACGAPCDVRWSLTGS
jgi:hypothetical protein